MGWHFKNMFVVFERGKWLASLNWGSCLGREKDHKMSRSKPRNSSLSCLTCMLTMVNMEAALHMNTVWIGSNRMLLKQSIISFLSRVSVSHFGFLLRKNRFTKLAKFSPWFVKCVCIYIHIYVYIYTHIWNTLKIHCKYNSKYCLQYDYMLRV